MHLMPVKCSTFRIGDIVIMDANPDWGLAEITGVAHAGLDTYCNLSFDNDERTKLEAINAERLTATRFKELSL